MELRPILILKVPILPDLRDCKECHNSFIPRPQKYRFQVFCGYCGGSAGRSSRLRQRRRAHRLPLSLRKCPACFRLFQPKRPDHATCSARCRYYRTKVKYIYKLSDVGYEELVNRSAGLCEICGDPKPLRLLHIDHNHDTGTVRGLLCVPCNHDLGFFERLTTKKLTQIQDYLGRNNG